MSAWSFNKMMGAVALAGLLSSGPALAKKDAETEGVNVKITVLADTGDPIPTAVIRVAASSAQDDG